MKKAGFGVVVTLLLAGVAAGSIQPEQGKPATQTFEGLEIALVSAERSTAGSIGGACPPRMSGFVQVRMNRGRVLVTTRLRFKVTGAYKGAKIGKILIEDDKGEGYETSVDLGDFANPGGPQEYECSFMFSAPNSAKFGTLKVEAASFDLGQALKSK